ncbi:MAG: sensor domain-containing protein [Anaerolineales bacterium]|nr:sensor domain-containing protein [Anaerolineales bacterium]
MNKPNQTVGRIFRVMADRQAYQNLIYLGAAFPLGIFYFVFLVSGISLGLSTVIVWVGIPILLLVGFGWWLLARFEYTMAVHLLNEVMPPMTGPSNQSADTWTRFKTYFSNPVTWKSLLYLFLKFPLGLATFVILITLISLTLAFLSMPLTYESLPSFQIGMGLPVWSIDSLGDALLCVVIGLLLWPVTLHITNGLAWVHAKFARLMLSVNPWEQFA